MGESQQYCGGLPAAAYTWWGPFGTNSAEAVIREATATKTMKTGSMVAIAHNDDEVELAEREKIVLPTKSWLPLILR